MNILVFRSIRPEEMGYVLIDVFKKYGDESRITILTNKQNLLAMKSIKNVYKVITYSGNNFIDYKEFKNELYEFTKLQFEHIIIPTNGNIETYKNIELFANKNFLNKSIKYYVYPNTFIKPPRFKFTNSIIMIISRIVSIPFIIILIFIALYVKIIEIIKR
jgi:hypothetical protein